MTEARYFFWLPGIHPFSLLSFSCTVNIFSSVNKIIERQQLPNDNVRHKQCLKDYKLFEARDILTIMQIGKVWWPIFDTPLASFSKRRAIWPRSTEQWENKQISSIYSRCLRRREIINWTAPFLSNETFLLGGIHAVDVIQNQLSVKNDAFQDDFC